MTARYAIYYTPAEDDPLTRLAEGWLGRSAFTNESVPVCHDRADVLVAAPRHYGFHATLKAPFELLPGKDEESLIEAVSRFCDGQYAFTAHLTPNNLGPFLALTLTSPSDDMERLHTRCVRDFDGFRAPMAEYDLVRRRKAGLTPHQDARLQQWGYPYIFDEFRFHMTLTSAIPDEEKRNTVMAQLRSIFEPREQLIDGVAIYFQQDRTRDFTVLKRIQFAG